MNSEEYQYALMSWSKSVRKRDNYICKTCGNEADVSHHIFYKTKYPQLSLTLDNGVSLCEDCHIFYHDLNGWK